MHSWPNKSIIKSANKNNVKEILAKRPKGITDEVWNLIASDHKLNKLIVLNAVPKESKKAAGPRRSDKE
jgi:ribosomal protein L20A (L18A)